MSMRHALTTLLAILLPSVATAEGASETWVVKKGDTCSSIAAAFYGDASFFTSIHQANDLGAPPHDLKPGMTLILPMRPDAHVAQKRGTVQARGPEADWVGASEGLELYRAWRLNTLDRARALVGFRDDSELLMRENTLIVIYGASAGKARQRGARAELSSGALRSRLGELSGVTVETPSAMATLGAGSAIIAVDESAKTRVSNHTGASTALASKSAPDAPVTVDAGWGSAVEKGKLPTKPRPLPPAPGWLPGPREFATLASTAVRASWSSVAAAKEYFVELAADPEGVQIMQAAYVSLDVTALEVRGLPAGTYWATVSAIDDQGFESIPSKRLELQVAAFGVPAGARSMVDPPRYYAGTTLRAPDGFRCRAGGAGAFETSFPLSAKNAPHVRGEQYPGWVESAEVECEGPGGTTTELVEIEIPAFDLRGATDGTIALGDGEVRFVGLEFGTGWIQTETTATGIQIDTLHDAASTSRVRLIAEPGFEAQTITFRAGDVPLLDVDVVRIEVVPEVGRIPIAVGGAALGFVTPAGVAGRDELSGSVGARVFAFAEVTPWFALGASLDALVLTGVPTFAPAPGVEARFMLPGGARPYASLGARALLPVDGPAFGAIEPALGVDLPMERWGFDARAMGSVFSESGRARVRPGLLLGLYRVF